MTRLCLLVLGALLPFAACSHAEASSPAFRIRLERTACFGTCPIYSVTVHGDGRVVFRGTRFVAAVGVRRARISRTRVQRLVEGVRKARVFAMRDRYDEMRVSDLPSAIVGVRLGPRTKHIYHYLGDRSAPKRLADLECLVDRIAGTDRWAGRASCPAPAANEPRLPRL